MKRCAIRSRGGYTSAALALLMGLMLGACGGSLAHERGPSFDEPVPASEPREELTLSLELAHRLGCEEDFDLVLYEELGVELVRWEPPHSECGARSMTIRYFPKKITRDALIKRVSEIATKVEAQ